MNLETYLETNNFEKKDLTILFSVGNVLNTKTGDTFPLGTGGTINFSDDEKMNVVTDEFDTYWWENLGKWKADERLVLDTINNVNDEPYDHSIDTIDPDESELPGPNPNTYGYNDTISDEEVDWLESKVELAMGI